jgi:hypothetical protein
MRTVRRLSLALAGLLLIHSPAAGQELTFGGQVRPRFEYRNPILVSGGEHQSWISMRTRGHLTAGLERNVSVFIQFQDVRIWGEEANTLGDFSADNLDLHQAYVDVRSDGPTELAARAGRQEVSFGGQRLVGAVNWSQQGRSFDALKLIAEGSTFRLDVLGAVLADDIAATHDNDQYVLAAYGQLHQAGPGTLDFYGLYNRVSDIANTDQVTVGARWWGTKNSIQFRLEASYQTGEREAVDVSAFMFGARVGTALARGTADVTLWYDYLSGDDDATDDKIKVFDTLFATNHKFYGLADHFTNIPLHTAGRGLQDIAVKGSFVAASDVTFRAEVHSFHAARNAGLSTGHFGEEIDLTASYGYSPNLGLSGGFAYVLAADGWGNIGRLTENAAWSFVMVDARF